MKQQIKKLTQKLPAFGLALAAVVMPLAVGAIGSVNTQLDAVIAPTGLQNTPLMTIIGAIIGTILTILGVILVLLILYAGFLWMTSQGDATKTKKAKDMIYQAIIGLLIVFAAYAITTFVLQALVSISGGTVSTS